LLESALHYASACPGLCCDGVDTQLAIAFASDLTRDDRQHGELAQGERRGETGRHSAGSGGGAAAANRLGPVRRAARRPRSGVGAFLRCGSPWAFQNLSAALYGLGCGLCGVVWYLTSGVSLPKRAANFIESRKIARGCGGGVELLGNRHGSAFGLRNPPKEWAQPSSLAEMQFPLDQEREVRESHDANR